MNLALLLLAQGGQLGVPLTLADEFPFFVVYALMGLLLAQPCLVAAWLS